MAETRTRKPRKTAPKRKLATRKSTKPKKAPIIEEKPIVTETRIETNLDDRMLRYKRNPRCPKCDAHPVVCMMRRKGYAAFRCRVCSHRWEVKD